MDKETRNAIDRATQRARALLEADFAAQLEGDFDVLASGSIGARASKHLRPRQVFTRDKVIAAIEHKRASELAPAAAVADYLRDAAFTTLNRFAALKMLEARGLVQTCVSKGEESSGYVEFVGMAPGVKLLPDGQGYRLYLECIFDELSTEVKVLFDRRDPASALWPRRATLLALLELLNDSALASVWGQDETIGWIYQYFNALTERQAMKDTKSGGSQAPRNSRELATRNQFFTPRYIVRFLTDNTLGRLWWEMRGGDTALREQCELLAIAPDATPAPRPKKDPRDLRIIDPACGSGHFLLYVFDLLLVIYEEAWADPAAPAWSETGRALRDDYPTLDELRRAAPLLIVERNLYGVDIDPRCVQIASFALWLRAQRAWRDLDVARTARPRVERSHVVVAEPMAGGEALVAAFASQLGHPALAALFRNVVEAFRLAGDLGVLLKAESLLAKAIDDAERTTRQSELFSHAGQSRAFWASAEARLLESLARFADGDAGAEVERRRLFRHDAASGFALLDVIRTEFDVALMNPPFGDPSDPAKQYIEDHYDDSRQDLFAVFVDRCVRQLVPHGFVGCISTEAGFFRRTLEPWRRNVLLGSGAMSVMAHLGGHVLDGATVRVAAYAIATRRTSERSLYLRLLHVPVDDREITLGAGLLAFRRGSLPAYGFVVDQSEFAKLPYAVFGYWCSPELRDVFVANPSLEGSAGVARQGLATADDFRFLRLRWEVPADSVSADGWMPFAKGGEYSPYTDDVHLVLGWAHAGAELKAWPKSYPRNVDLFGSPGITWPPRTNKRFAPRVFPHSAAFGHKGPVVVKTAGEPWALLAYLNSRVVGYLIGFGTGATEVEGGTSSNSYEVGLVQRLPVPTALPADPALTRLGREAWTTRAEASLRDETAVAFTSPCAPFALLAPLVDTWRRLVDRDKELLQRYEEAQWAVDARVSDLLALSPADCEEVERNVGDIHRPGVDASDAARATWVGAVVSFAIGCAFGRWNPSRLLSASSLPPERAFDPPQAHSDEIPSRPPILVDDEGHPLDIVAQCTSALAAAIAEPEATVAEAATLLGAPSLRGYLRTAFFDAHWSTYSKSKRSAAIYLPLTTSSGSYTVWLYLHRLGAATLFDVGELVENKLRFEDTRLAALEADAGTDARKIVGAQRALVEELRGLADEVRRVKPLWKPDLDDGVVINFAPLWRLVPQHKAWQKELRETWAALCAGEYDWSHLAMHLWPERVVPRCATDRSFAIAHGLEDIFWVEDAKGKWIPRATPTRPVDELIAERTSAAVTAARDSLINAPTPGGGGASKKKRAAPKLRRPRR